MSHESLALCMSPPNFVTNYRTMEIFGRGKLAKFSSPIFTDTLKMYLAYALTVASLFAKFFLTNSFYLYGSPKFPLPNIFHVQYSTFMEHFSSTVSLEAVMLYLSCQGASYPAGCN